MPKALTWSVSRGTTLDTCERRYFFEYLSGARSNSKSPRLREIAALKHLKSLAMWQGEVLHEIAAKYLSALQQGRRPSAERVAEVGMRAVDKVWRDPAFGQPEGTQLFEHVYGGLLSEEVGSETSKRVGMWLHRLVEWAEQAELWRAIMEAQRIWIEPPVFGPSAPGFMLDGTQVLAKVDLAIRSKDGCFSIFDWKTGRPPITHAEWTDSAEHQVTVYQLWPHRSLQIPFDAITAHVVYVNAEPMDVRTYGIDGDIGERALRKVGGDIRRGRALHGLGDHAPLSEQDFDLAANPWACRFCVFKRLCQEELAK